MLAGIDALVHDTVTKRGEVPESRGREQHQPDRQSLFTSVFELCVLLILLQHYAAL